jgi:hypothetical protein
MNIKARAADLSKKSDREPFVQFVFNTPGNLFDQKVMFYPTSNTIAVELDDVPVFFGPFHAVVMLESLAFAPDLNDRQRAVVLRRFHDGIENACINLKIREIFFVCMDPRVAEFAIGRGYTEINGAQKDIAGNVVTPSLADWAKEHGYPGTIKRVLKMKLPGPEDALPNNPILSIQAP